MPVVDFLGFETELIPLIKGYFFVTAFSTFGAYLHPHCVNKCAISTNERAENLSIEKLLSLSDVINSVIISDK